MSAPLLRTQDVSFIITGQNTRTHVHDITLHAGEVLFLTGASGTGKTYFLDVTEGLVANYSGVLERRGPCVRIFQDFRLVLEHSALDNVLNGLIGKRTLRQALAPSAEDIRQAKQWLEKFGIAEKSHQPAFQLSTGEAQRVAIARALMAQPALLIADEPFSALDEFHTTRVMQAIEEECATRGMGALIVTHKLPTHSENVPTRNLSLIRSKADTKAERVNYPSSNSLYSNAGNAALAALIFITALSVFWLVPGLKAGTLSGEMLLRFLGQMIPDAAEWQAMPWQQISHALADTLAMAGLATLISILLSLPLSMLATRGLAPNIIARIIRAILNWWRAIPSIIWALICVAAVGLGTVSGLLALVLYSMGYLTKFFYESFEQVDRKPSAYLMSLGASRMQVAILALWPAAVRSVLSSGLFMLEYNVRAASILGIVGAGGIGAILKESVEWSNWHVVATIIFLMGFMVIAIDSFSSWLRQCLLPERKTSALTLNNR